MKFHGNTLLFYFILALGIFLMSNLYWFNKKEGIKNITTTTQSPTTTTLSPATTVTPNEDNEPDDIEMMINGMSYIKTNLDVMGKNIDNMNTKIDILIKKMK